ncbi:MAG TPA: PDZ domain-containing protein [Bacteroidota bacterium]|nr:PDZ domain-containing protein [Bacteroidota bacterium]
MKNFALRLFVLLSFVLTISTWGCSRQLHNHVYVLSDRSERSWLGVQLEDITSRLKERKNLTISEGAYVSDVVDDSPAERAGIEEGDVIVKFDGTAITNSDDLMRAVRKTPPKSEIKIEVLRKGDRKTLSAILGRQRSPQAFSYHFEMPRIPAIPRIPRIPRTPFHMYMNLSEADEGLTLQPLTKQLADYFEVPDRRGILVSEVEDGSRAEKAGFKAGDVITKINGHTVRDVEDFQEELSDSRDTTASFELIRKGKTVSVSMKIEREDDDEDSDGESDDYSFNSCSPSRSATVSSDWWVQKHDWIAGQVNVLQERIVEVEHVILDKLSVIQNELRRAFS